MFLISKLVSPFRQFVTLLRRNRELTVELAKREVTERYSGQLFGALWVFVHPLFMIGLYVFVFSAVLDMRTEGLDKHGVNYTVYLLAGLIPWMAFSEALSKGCYAVTSNASLVKQVVFPLEVLPVRSVVTAVLNQLLASVLMFGYIFFSGNSVRLLLVMYPVLFMFQVLAMLGFAYLLSTLCVFIKDIKDFVQLFCMAGLFLIPVFYLPDWVPELFEPVLFLNPFSHMVWCYQDLLVYGEIVHPVSWVVFSVFSVVVFALGFNVFSYLKSMFGNAL